MHARFEHSQLETPYARYVTFDGDGDDDDFGPEKGGAPRFEPKVSQTNVFA